MVYRASRADAAPAETSGVFFANSAIQPGRHASKHLNLPRARLPHSYPVCFNGQQSPRFKRPLVGPTLEQKDEPVDELAEAIQRPTWNRPDVNLQRSPGNGPRIVLDVSRVAFLPGMLAMAIASQVQRDALPARRRRHTFPAADQPAINARNRPRPPAEQAKQDEADRDRLPSHWFRRHARTTSVTAPGAEGIRGKARFLPPVRSVTRSHCTSGSSITPTFSAQISPCAFSPFGLK